LKSAALIDLTPTASVSETAAGAAKLPAPSPFKIEIVLPLKRTTARSGLPSRL
jgi:hypothetical protein